MQQESKRVGGQRRRYEASFKQQVLAECAAGDRPFVDVARAHGLDVKLVHQWRIRARTAATPMRFVPVALSATTPQPATPTHEPPAPEPIRIEVHRGATVLCLHWPIAQLSALTAWLDPGAP